MELVPSSLAEHVVEYELIPLSFVSTNYIDLFSLSLMDLYIECKDISLTYYSVDMVDQ